MTPAPCICGHLVDEHEATDTIPGRCTHEGCTCGAYTSERSAGTMTCAGCAEIATVRLDGEIVPSIACDAGAHGWVLRYVRTHDGEGILIGEHGPEIEVVRGRVTVELP